MLSLSRWRHITSTCSLNVFVPLRTAIDFGNWSRAAEHEPSPRLHPANASWRVRHRPVLMYVWWIQGRPSQGDTVAHFKPPFMIGLNGTTDFHDPPTDLKVGCSLPGFVEHASLSGMKTEFEGHSSVIPKRERERWEGAVSRGKWNLICCFWNAILWNLSEA